MNDTALIRRARDLVAIPSVNPMGREDLPKNILYEKHAADYTAKEMKRIGLGAKTFEIAPGRSNAVAHLETPGKPWVLLDAHLDTVPVDGMENPFDPVLKNEVIYGRGSCDTKGSLAVFLTAIEELVIEKKELAYSICVSGTMDEELHASGAKALEKSLAPKMPSLAIFGEPTSLNIIHAHKGLVRLGIETRGQSAHASRPSLGNNAIYTMAKVLKVIEELGKRLENEIDPILGYPTINPGLIHGGISVNTVPDLCRIEVDVRLTRGQNSDTVRHWISSALSTASLKNWEITSAYHESPSMFTDPETPLAKAFIHTCLHHGHATGQPEKKVQVAPYATNAQAFAEGTIPCLVFGPGDIGLAHTRGECVPVAELRNAVEILKSFLTQKN